MKRKRLYAAMAVLLAAQTFAGAPWGGADRASASTTQVESAVLPSGWQAAAIEGGDGTGAVSAGFEDGAFAVSVEAGGIKSGGDSIGFVYMPVNGQSDFTLTARISEFQHGESDAWALLMVKEGLEPTSQFVSVGYDYNNGKRIRDYRRLPTTGGGNTPVAEDAHYVRLQRVGDELKHLYSVDGETFASRTTYQNDTRGQNAVLDLDTIYVGFAAATASVTFDEVVFEVDGQVVFDSEAAVVDPIPPATPTGLAAVGKDQAVDLSWDTVTGATYYQVKQSFAELGDYTVVDTVYAPATTTTIGQLVNGTPHYFKVSAANPFGESADSDPVLGTPTGLTVPGEYELGGFAMYTTGGGALPETDPGYKQVTDAAELHAALNDPATKVIEVMNDLDLGWEEIPESARSAPFAKHNEPLTHPVLLETGVSKITIAGVNGLTLFSRHGAEIRHAAFTIKNSKNVIIRNLEFDELWEWDEATKGEYDRNDWDYISIEDGSENIWIDHATFNKAYDGVVDVKGASNGVTISWSLIRGDDGGADGWVAQQFDELERLPAKYPMYQFLRGLGLTKEDVIAISAGQKKGHLVGSGTTNDNAALEITLHHNYYDDLMDRIPRLRGGNAHVYNVVVDSTDAYEAGQRLTEAMREAIAGAGYKFDVTSNAAISTENGAVSVESSVIRDVAFPIRNNQTDPDDPFYTGKIRALNTLYSYGGTEFTGGSDEDGSPLAPAPAAAIPFSWTANEYGGIAELPYLPHAMLAPEALEARLAAADGAGAGNVFWSKDNWLKTEGYTGPIATTSGEAPTVVGGLRAKAGDEQAALRWGSVSQASTYNVYRASSADGAYALIADGLTGETYVDTGLANGAIYYYKVSAANADGEGPMSSAVAAAPFALTAPVAPSGVTLTSASTKVILDWDAVEGADYYLVMRSETDGEGFETISGEVFDTRYEDVEAVEGVTCYYVVVAVNAAGESERSAQVSGALVELRDEAGLTLLLEDDFNEGTAGELPSGYTVNEAMGTIRYADIPSAEDKSLRFHDTGSGIVQWDAAFESQPELVVAQFDFMKPAKRNSVKVLRLAQGSGLGSTSNGAAGVAIETNGGHLAYRNTSGYTPFLLNYEANTWYTIKVVANVATGKADVYVDGEIRLEQADFFNAVEDISLVQSFTPNGDADEYYVDNLRVYGYVVPSPPAGLTAEAGDREVALAWEAAEGATRYRVYRSETSGGPYEPVAETAELAYADEGLSNGTTYYYVVGAANPKGESEPSEEANARPSAPRQGGGAPPSTPSQGAVVERTEDGVRVKLPTGREIDAGGRTVAKVVVESLNDAIRELASTNGERIALLVEGDAAAAEVVISARAWIEAAEAAPGLTLSVEHNGATYDVPVRALNFEDLASRLGVAEDEIGLTIGMSVATEDVKASIRDRIARENGSVVSEPMEFTITAEADGNAASVNDFGDLYVSRTLRLSEAVDPAAATVALYDPETGALTFVPAVFATTADGVTEATFKRTGNSTYVVVALKKSFDDLVGHWAKSDIELLASKLLVRGESGDAYAPDREITRAEFAALLVRALGLTESIDSSFSDVDDGSWYAGSVGAAVRAKLVFGFEDGTFRPGERITREAMAVMLARALTFAGAPQPDAKNGAPRFPDGSEIGVWAREGVSAAVAAGIASGASGAAFRPGAEATRAEAAVMLKRFLQYASFIDE
ncbi:S-layer homology domain-containing protein [Paenibacillus sp.]|uniref:S-layer homology domain-containing protein n=1 Tax=Paenibacillus sp. TaxID=58172 RepID=UPI002D657AF1|nr:S-layer homology domain-containing protein [Paenibacillus sp.]HZG55259.1 S-layer homology domain-containing protein [Paenibacillus sp.]